MLWRKCYDGWENLNWKKSRQSGRLSLVLSMLRLPSALSLVLLALVLATGSGVAKEVVPAAKVALDKWIAGQAGMESLQATFVQERKLRAVRRPLVSNGRMWWRKDGGFRWEVGDPPKVVTIQATDGRVANLKPHKLTAELRSKEAAEEAMHGLGFGFSAFFDADPSAWEGKLELRDCYLAEDNPDHLVAEFGFREAKISAALLKMVIIADVGRSDLHQFLLVFRDTSSILLSFDPMQKNVGIDDSMFTIDLTGYKVKDKG